MLVNIEDNKFQILIASGVSIIYYNYSKNEINSMCLDSNFISYFTQNKY